MIYDPSWLGYGNTLDAPADNVTFFNVGLITSRMSALQEQINQLEKELAEARAKKIVDLLQRRLGSVYIAPPAKCRRMSNNAAITKTATTIQCIRDIARSGSLSLPNA